MSTYAGPNIIEDGLVLCLDAANEKSFRGEPTTNELVQITWAGDGTPTIATITDQSLTYKGYFTQSVIGGTSNNCYLNGADISTSRTSDVWTFSCYLRREDKQPITSMNVYMYYPSSDGSAAATIEDVGDGWYRLSRTRTGSVNYIGLAGFTGLVSGVKYYLSGAQLEKKPYPTVYVNTNTTRGTTVATGGGWVDISGKNVGGDTTGNPQFNRTNKNSLIFNGTSDWYTIPFNSANMNFSLGQTICMVLKPRVGANSARRNPYGQAYGGSGTITHEMSGAFNYYFGTNGGNGSPYVGRTSSFTVQADELAFIAVTRDQATNTVKWYKNNTIVDNLDAGGYASTNNGSSPITIGDGYVSPFLGDIYNVYVYNRGLSENEIKQNFYVTNLRYGI